MRGERILRHPLVDEVVVLGDGLVADERVEDEEGQRADGADEQRQAAGGERFERAQDARS
ncbi:MAG TPA: hypothetical protein VGR12_07775 [Solirubrobacteraceae bacterium]|nr:hypothetical protein [Solirubrobacteraceae bacterium]